MCVLAYAAAANTCYLRPRGGAATNSEQCPRAGGASRIAVEWPPTVYLRRGVRRRGGFLRREAWFGVLSRMFLRWIALRRGVLCGFGGFSLRVAHGPATGTAAGVRRGVYTRIRSARVRMEFWQSTRTERRGCEGAGATARRPTSKGRWGSRGVFGRRRKAAFFPGVGGFASNHCMRRRTTSRP
jgi:hypothetical protein